MPTRRVTAGEELYDFIAEEAKIVDIGKVWLPTCSEEETCAACDFAPTCSKPAGQKKTGDPPPPHAP